MNPGKVINYLDNNTFIDNNIWTKRKSCCGPVFECRTLKAIMIDASNCKPCQTHKTLFSGGKKTASKQSSDVNTTITSKKQYMFLKRQSESFQKPNISDIDVKTDSLPSSSLNNKCVKSGSLHKIKPESDIQTSKKMNTQCLPSIKENMPLVILKADECLTDHNKPNTETVNTAKYSDNSEDSGFDENDRKSITPVSLPYK